MSCADCPNPTKDIPGTVHISIIILPIVLPDEASGTRIDPLQSLLDQAKKSKKLCSGFPTNPKF